MERRLAEMAGAMRAAGFRVTPQRREVLRILAKSAGHPDAGRIHRTALRTFPDVSLATVYKTLAALKAAVAGELRWSATRFDLGRGAASRLHELPARCMGDVRQARRPAWRVGWLAAGRAGVLKHPGGGRRT